MQTITLIYTKRLWNPASWLIRLALPKSFLCPAASSHVIVVDGDHAIEAHMIYGVRRVPLSVALHGAKVVAKVTYQVPDAERGLAWFRSQICTYLPKVPAWLPKWARKAIEMVSLVLHNNYDFKGALGLGLAPNRNWQDPAAWHCYEGAGMALTMAGLDVFADTGFVTETTLLAIRHEREKEGLAFSIA